MELSIFFAKLFGIYLVVACAGVLFNRGLLMPMIKDASDHPILFVAFGSLDLLLGTTIVLLHNDWELGWPIIITLLGWLILIKGAVRLLFPNFVIRKARGLSEGKGGWVIPAYTFFLLLGILLIILGFFTVIPE